MARSLDRKDMACKDWERWAGGRNVGDCRRSGEGGHDQLRAVCGWDGDHDAVCGRSVFRCGADVYGVYGRVLYAAFWGLASLCPRPPI